MIYVKKNIIHLNTDKTSYIMEIFKGKYLLHLYYGEKTQINHGYEYEDFNSFSPNPDKDDITYSLDTLPQEVSFGQIGDFRSPSVEIEFKDGSKVTNFLYDSYKIYEGKPSNEHLPTSHIGPNESVETIEIKLVDSLKALELYLYYTVFESKDTIAVSKKIVNLGSEEIYLDNLASLSMDFHEFAYDYIHFPGSWVRERDFERCSVTRGTHVVDSKRGSSSHNQNPAMIILDKKADEFSGHVYGFNLIYSGSFKNQIETSSYNQMRFSMGINPYNFRKKVASNSNFHSPEAIVMFSSGGINGLSSISHSFVNDNIIPSNFRNAHRPILINNWEATYFDFNEEKILEIAKASKEFETELFVLDDGWFGIRNSDKSGLGDWFVNKEKLPSGIENIGKKINDLGINFGIWVEPEMVSPDSDLYRKHPDWCFHVDGRNRTEARNQLLLNLSLPEVCDYLYDSLEKIFSTEGISYVKWDYNRNMTEIYSKNIPADMQGEVGFNYYKGLYGLLDRLVTRFPNILFESCSGGGGRFDLGMLKYMPQTWTSDNTDALARLNIQYSTSIFYPVVAMGSHISDVPNHQTGRSVPLKFRADVAMSGNLGLELDSTKIDEKSKVEIKEYLDFYKENREIIQNGAFYRIRSPYDGNITSWMFKGRGEKEGEVLVFIFRGYKKANMPKHRIKIPYLDDESLYLDKDKKCMYSGSELRNYGITIDHSSGDFQSEIIKLKEQ